MLSLTPEEQSLLAGAAGPGVQRAMAIVVALGRIYGAADLTPVQHVQISGVSYKNLGDAGVEFLNEWADAGAKVRVSTTLNPAGMELERWEAMGISPDFARPQLTAVGAFVRMGVNPTMSCTPYLLPDFAPRRGDHLAWAESSAVAWANSVVGAYTNREGGPSALAAAIVGRTARYGFHLDENRTATHIVEVACPVRDVADFGALSYLVGRAVGDGTPFFPDLGAWLPPLPQDLTLGGEAGDRLKTLGAGIAAYGAVALFHVAGYTPEARDLGERLIRPDAKRWVIDTLAPAYQVMDANPETTAIDLVTIGCPHASLSELQRIAERLQGERLRTRLWVTTARLTRERAAQAGWVQIIEAAGGEVVADTCAVVAPVRSLGIRSMATNAGKMACYAPMHSKVTMRYGDLDRCLEAALTGQWRDPGPLT
ncbi:MAG: aconitase X catalytic domain-containing protein [Caldilineales bacterium]|nr:aconitase X catalytic domain-containing protein [Caldilineales bacterium]MCW5857103.1 aconitase X catalytic domain-containing protein [Caldilineales bacterium]